MTVIIQENHTNHTVALTGLTRAGSMYDTTGKWGTASLTAEMLPRGTTSKTALQLALSLESVGASVGTSASSEAANFSGQCLSKDFDLTLTTLADELRHPAFPADQLERLRRQTISSLEEAKQDTGGTGGAGAQAEIAFSEALFPEGSPFWSPTIDQSETSTKAITADDLRAFYDAHYRPDTATLVIVGDIDAAKTLDAVKAAFGDWAKPTTPPTPFHDRRYAAARQSAADARDLPAGRVADQHPVGLPRTVEAQ